MQEMIRRILEIDEEARQLNEQAVHLKIENEMTIGDKKKKLRDDYLTRARERIDKLREAERNLAQKDFEEVIRQQDAVEKEMLSCYEKNAERWVEALVEDALQ